MIKEKKIGIPHVLVFILAIALADLWFSPVFKKIVFSYSQFIDKRVLGNLKEQDCVEFLLSLDKKIAIEKTGKTNSWVSENWMFNLWDKPTHLGKGLPVGRMKCGATAIIIEKEGDDYKICSPYDESIGWINKKQVSFTFYQNPKTEVPCN
tara:strand:+ start:645 stop:1097 length:453 start_codon:yes stop_codon:yes gene_type:complete